MKYSRDKKYKRIVDVIGKPSLTEIGWDSSKKNVIIIHGFNGTESKTPMSFIKDGELKNKTNWRLTN